MTSPTITKEAPPRNWWKQIERPSIRTQGILRRAGERAVRARRVRDTTGKPQNQLTWGHRSSQRINQQPESLHGTDLFPLFICYRYVTWSSCKTPNSESRACLWLCFLLWGPNTFTGLQHPALTEEEEPSLTATWYTMADWYPWDACLYLKKTTGGGVDGIVGVDWEDKREGNL